MCLLSFYFIDLLFCNFLFFLVCVILEDQGEVCLRALP